MKNLKPLVLAVGFMLISALSLFAEPTDIYIKTWKKHGTVSNGSIGHAPMHLPVEVTFDDATGVLTVQAPEELEGAVYVYNVSGTLETSSDHLNATFILTSPGLHIISFQAEEWFGEGRFIL